MRVKTEAKRRAILDAAMKAFREFGVEATSMSEIAARVGGSKTTLYSYFSSKEELVLEILLATGEKHGKEAFEALGATKDVRAGLKELGLSHLRFITDPDNVAILRLAVAEGGRSDLGRKFYERGPCKFESLVSQYLQTLIVGGELRDGNSDMMAQHLRALFEAEVLLKVLFGAAVKTHVTDLQGMAERAVDAFFGIYGVSKRQVRKTPGRR